MLGLGIVGLLCCGPLGIVAYIFGKNDLAEMDAGVMDPSGRGTTNVGRILGIVAMVFLVIQILFIGVRLLTGKVSASWDYPGPGIRARSRRQRIPGPLLCLARIRTLGSCTPHSAYGVVREPDVGPRHRPGGDRPG